METSAGRAAWKADSRMMTSFMLTTTSGSVVIGSIDDDGTEPYEAILLNPDGIAIERLQSEWEDIPPTLPTYPPTAAPTIRPPASWNVALANLFEAARTRTINLDGVIGGILEDVQNPKVVSRRPGTDDDIPF